MDFEAYSERLATLHEYCFHNKAKKKKKKKKNRVKKISGSKQINTNGISQKNTVCRVK